MLRNLLALWHETRPPPPMPLVSLQVISLGLSSIHIHLFPAMPWLQNIFFRLASQLAALYSGSSER
jgi:hypothetical protein